MITDVVMNVMILGVTVGAALRCIFRLTKRVVVTGSVMPTRRAPQRSAAPSVGAPGLEYTAYQWNVYRPGHSYWQGAPYDR